MRNRLVVREQANNITARAGRVFGALVLSAGSLVFVAGNASATTCHYHRSGNHWVCITPGAYCPDAAHHHYGLDKYNLKRKYWCENNHGWRWEPNK